MLLWVGSTGINISLSWAFMALHCAESWQSGVWWKNALLLWNVMWKPESVAHTWHSFRTKFGNEHKGHDPSQKKNHLLGVKQKHETGSNVPMKQKGPKQMACMLGNIAAVSLVKASFHDLIRSNGCQDCLICLHRTLCGVIWRLESTT